MRHLLRSRLLGAAAVMCAIWGPVTLAPAARNSTAECVVSCNADRPDCIGDCVGDQHQCRSECPPGAAGRQCVQACAAVHRACTSSCVSGVRDCIRACPRGNESPSAP